MEKLEGLGGIPDGDNDGDNCGWGFHLPRGSCLYVTHFAHKYKLLAIASIGCTPNSNRVVLCTFI